MLVITNKQTNKNDVSFNVKVFLLFLFIYFLKQNNHIKNSRCKSAFRTNTIGASNVHFYSSVYSMSFNCCSLQRFGELVRKMWNMRNFKSHVSPHEVCFTCQHSLKILEKKFKNFEKFSQFNSCYKRYRWRRKNASTLASTWTPLNSFK